MTCKLCTEKLILQKKNLGCSFFNPLEEVVNKVVMVVVNKVDVCVMDTLEIQVSPKWGYEKDKLST
jgi:hypothetical protein